MLWRTVTPVLASMLLAGCAPVAAPSAAPTVTEPASVTLRPVEVAAGTLYAPAGLASGEQQAWLERLERASEAVTDADLGALDDGWDGRIVVELPLTRSDYLMLAGAEGDQAAASTRCGAEGSRITINPLVREESSTYLDALLLHEAVHVATGSGCVDAPLWIEEGLAEWLTEQHDPATQRANQEWLDHELAAGLPSGLPAAAAFQGTSARISGAYALAAFAVATAIDHLGQDQAMAYFGAPDEPTTVQLTQWYLAALRARLVPPPASANAQR
ncbi:MAG: hypothetical protein QM628_07375 [Propionicimonas sp.]